jgi:hypothetical protein
MKENDQLESDRIEYHSKRKLYVVLYKRFVVIVISFLGFYLLILNVISTSILKPLIVFPVFMLTIYQCGRYFTKMINLKKYLKLIAKKYSNTEKDLM